VARPRFDISVPTNGYHWWYIDALSEDGVYGLTIIGFVGSVFSPYYKRARSKGLASPENHCAINMALYGPKKRWAMTERGLGHVSRDIDRFKVGPSSMRWLENGTLAIDIDERCMPLPRRLLGRVLVKPEVLYDVPVALDKDENHFWQAVAPQCRVSVEFDNPKLVWSGSAYHDMNWGSEPVENEFKQWTWLRANTETGTQVLYDVQRRDGSQIAFGRRYFRGAVFNRDMPRSHELKRGFWGMHRAVQSENAPKLISTLEDTPFYTRNHINMNLDGERCEAFHESLSLDRFSNPVVQLMLPFRMPRVR
jgi:carotenoid 1,2-hydratase